jgi:TonB family protein
VGIEQVYDPSEGPTMMTSRCALAILLIASGAALQPEPAFRPARYEGGSPPALPVMAVGGGEVIVEVAVGDDGQVGAVSVLRATPPFTDAITEAVKGWRFTPADELVPARTPGDPPSRKNVESSVLVVGMFRPPSILEPTHGEAARDAAPASDAVPFPFSLTMPSYPPNARFSGVALLEGRVNEDGSLGEVTVLRSAPPFDSGAVAAARQWNFRPARHKGAASPAYVYMIFGFPVPIMGR